MLVNCFTIQLGLDELPVGSGVFLAGSAIDHSCRPNAIAKFGRGRELEIIALEDVDDINKVRTTSTSDRKIESRLHV